MMVSLRRQYSVSKVCIFLSIDNTMRKISIESIDDDDVCYHELGGVYQHTKC